MASTADSDFNILHLVVGIIFIWISYRLFVFFRFFRPKSEHSLRSVAVLVLGDIGRSPRMMYHAESFAEHGFMTYVIGYGGSKPIPALEREPKVQLRYLPEPPAIFKSLPFVLLAPLKIIHQVTSILRELLVNIDEPPEYILAQNPPSIPTLALVWLVGRIRGCKVIIDWHNLGYSILELKLPKTHLYVKIAKWFEATFGRTAYAHLFVTEAMRDFLVKEWDLVGEKVVLHDRPPKHFHRCSAQEIHDLFSRLKGPLSSLKDFLPESEAPFSTPMTDRKSSQTPTPTPTTFNANPISTTAQTYERVQPPRLRPDRPALVVSSTSWTPDEDFGVLLQALKQYEKRAGELAEANSEKRLPKMLMVVTGKGPQRDEYMKEINRLQADWRWVRCLSLWLEAKDYPTFLGSADVGVCLHSSSSALDLPMKVVDMFGCGLPVCALNFKCLPELVKDGKNGLIFNNSDELARQLESLLVSFPSSQRLDALRSSLLSATHTSQKSSAAQTQESEWCSWDENWSRSLKPLISTGVQI
ncbi:mannosyltransferase [Gymnopus androsaceus JB14]|uniref:Chitobiosyldiphosphodolichol beta-mannosyltransferase n=1 Tax=Gymnopus androsaceus JB14 TaxID=1447944 RepID=A0A6A4IFP2_9AGAR|nr:mannosyltransferase [Gymnopus androsaceus JB14]